MPGSTTLLKAQRVPGAELLERGERLRPGLVERQAEAERLRRVPEITMAEFHEAGILQAIQPVVFGGFEVDFINQIDLTYEIARACGASGWVVCRAQRPRGDDRQLPRARARRVVGRQPARARVQLVRFDGSVKRVAGGYVVSGHWRYSSGCDYCAYLVGGADAEEADGTGRRPRRRFLLPIAQLEIIDDWHVIGLAGTGSKSLRGVEVFVPEWLSLTDREFLTNTGPGRAFHDHSHLYRLSRFAHPGPLSLAMAAVGIAQHAVDYCAEHAGRMGVGRTSAVEREVIRHDLAESAAEVDAARLLIRRTVQEIERAGKERVDPVPAALIALVSRDRHFTTRLALRATERLFRAAGSHALFEGNELQRCFRDVHAVASRVTRLGGVSAAGSTEV